MIEMFISLLVATVLGVIVSFAYLFKTPKRLAENNLALSFVLMAPIVTIIMSFIGSNLALSLGMVGSLSIIRFRSAIKDSRDLIYLLWIMAIGIGCGTKNFPEVIGASGFIFFVVIILKFKKIQNPPLAGSLILTNPCQEIVEKISTNWLQQVVRTPEKSEFIYQIGVKEFEEIKSMLGPHGWTYIASKEV
jgi:hypothetical protein